MLCGSKAPCESNVANSMEEESEDSTLETQTVLPTFISEISESTRHYVLRTKRNVVSLVYEHFSQNGLPCPDFTTVRVAEGYRTTTSAFGKQFSSNVCSSKKCAKVSCCYVVLDFILRKPSVSQDLTPISETSVPAPRVSGSISESTRRFIHGCGGRNVVSLLFECLQAMKQMPPVFTTSHIGKEPPLFQTTVQLFGRTFSGAPCTKKREAKASCCYAAVDFIVQSRTLINPISSMNSLSKVINQLCNASKTIFDECQRIVYDHLLTQSQFCIEIQRSSKVIAAIFLYDASCSKCFLLSWATGNKCIHGDSISLEGRAVNDCHAEILARKGLLRFLYQQIQLYARNRFMSIFVSDGDRLKLRSSLSFHLFINTAPCGDGRTFSFASEESDKRNGSNHDPFYSKQRGLLRTKIEDGEGTVLIPCDLSRQTVDGVFGGERLRVMSCSDKILKWNVLGLQGCLLSCMINPIFLCSITIGQLFHYGNLCRSLCCRMKSTNAEVRANHPYLYNCSMSSGRLISKSCHTATNWNASDCTVEVIDSQTGRLHNSKASSRLCKLSFFQIFVETLRLIQPSSPVPSQELTYAEAKCRCLDYIKRRSLFRKNLTENGCGHWLTKPPEEEMFALCE